MTISRTWVHSLQRQQEAGIEIHSSLLNVVLRDDDGPVSTGPPNPSHFMRGAEPPRLRGEPADRDRARRSPLPEVDKNPN